MKAGPLSNAVAVVLNLYVPSELPNNPAQALEECHGSFSGPRTERTAVCGLQRELLGGQLATYQREGISELVKEWKPMVDGTVYLGLVHSAVQHLTPELPPVRRNPALM